MRRSRKDAAETRQRIVEAASQEFRRNGIEATGLAEVMAAAGLTHGGFYKHFHSKEQVVTEALALGAEALLASWDRTLASSDRGLRNVLTDYLSTAHRDEVAGGCPLAALACEMARCGEPVREEATRTFLQMADRVAGHLEGASPAAARKQAMWMLASMLGAVTLARVVSDPELSAAVLRETRRHVLGALPPATEK